MSDAKLDVQQVRDYEIHMDVKFAAGQVIDIMREAAAVSVPWFNQTLVAVNDSIVRLGVFNGDYHWHSHTEDDEFFLCLDGRLFIEIAVDEDIKTLTLESGQACTIAKGTRHRTRTLDRTTVVMIETNAVVPTGD